MKNWQISQLIGPSHSHTVEYVVAHGLQRMKKGKNPSLSMGPIRNPIRAFKFAQRVFAQTIRLEAEFAQKVARDARLLTRTWRSDCGVSAFPTVSTVVTHARDCVYVEGLFQVWVNHVNTIHGKGFKAVLEFGDCFVQTSDPVLLTANPAAFSAVCWEGMQMLYRKKAEWAKNDKHVRWAEFRLHSSKCQIRRVCHD